MKISIKTKYGVKAMYEIAKESQRDATYPSKAAPLSLREIASRQGLSEHYLEQIIGRLKRAGLIKARRGAKGGYVLSKPAKDITLADIVQALEGSMSVSDCQGEGGTVHHCGNPECCVCRGIWEQVSEAIENLLRSITLESLCADESQPH